MKAPHIRAIRVMRWISQLIVIWTTIPIISPSPAKRCDTILCAKFVCIECHTALVRSLWQVRTRTTPKWSIVSLSFRCFRFRETISSQFFQRTNRTIKSINIYSNNDTTLRDIQGWPLTNGIVTPRSGKNQTISKSITIARTVVLWFSHKSLVIGF